MPFMLTTIQQLSEILQELLCEDANRIGRESGFVQRERKFSGASFCQSLVFGWQANPEASLEDLCQSAQVCGVEISPQGLQERLNSQGANEFLYQLLMRGMSYLVTVGGVAGDLLERFSGVYIQDSSTIELPSGFEQCWQGNGAGQSTLKVQTLLDYQHGQLELKLASGRQHDSPLQTVDLPAGSLRLADVGYFKVEVFEQLNQQGVWWLSRLPARAGIWSGDKVIHTALWLAQQRAKKVDQVVELSAQRLPCRLIAVRVPKSVAQQRRKRVRQEAKDRPHSRLKPETLALCKWTLVVTNLDHTQLSPDEAFALLRLRWQIELLFKLWKHDLSVDTWRSQLPHQILSEVYAKLLLALIQHWLLLLGCWHNERRSLVKASHALRKHAFHLLASFTDLQSLHRALLRILPALARCSIQKRKARPATFQLLARASP
jgi:hypothetical protein